jgi:uncharacterized protein
MEFETRHVDGELRVEARGVAPIIRGYAIVFDRLSEDLGGFRERIRPSAVDRLLAERTDLRALVDHNHSQVLGRVSAGTLRVDKDGHGLKVEIDPPATGPGHDIVESIRRRDITGMSFAFRNLTPLDAQFVDDPDPATGLWIREITDMAVREVSIVTFPAYSQTEVAMRSLQAFTTARAHGIPRTVTARLAWSAQKFGR